jgi:EmrB/QacA subfamily drug resistance transporter
LIDARRRNMALLVSGCLFMEILDGTIVTTAAPVIARALEVSTSSISLVITAYFVTLGALIPLSGWLVARLGVRPVFLSAIAVFSVASLLCAMSTSLSMLVATRILQGTGAAMMVPVGRQVVFDQAAKQDITRLMGFIVWPALLAPVVAPAAGGIIATHGSWQWIFLVNVPLGAVAWITAFRIVRPTTPTRVPRLDVVGVILTATCIALLTYAMHLISESEGGARLVMVSAAAALSAALCGYHLLRVDAPLLDLRTLRVRTFRVSQTGGLLYFVVIGGVPFLLALEFQEGFGWSPEKAGAVLLLLFVGNAAIKPATTPVLERVGFRRVLMFAGTCLAVTTLGAGLLTSGAPAALIGATVLMGGVFRSLGISAYTTLALGDVADVEMRDANVLAVTTQQIAAGLAVAFSTVALRAGRSWADYLPGSPTSVSSFRIAFAVLAVVALAAVTQAAMLPSDAGDSLRRGRR